MIRKHDHFTPAREMRRDIVYRHSPLSPVDPSFRALSGRLKFTVRRHKFNKFLSLRRDIKALTWIERAVGGHEETSNWVEMVEAMPGAVKRSQTWFRVQGLGFGV